MREVGLDGASRGARPSRSTRPFDFLAAPVVSGGFFLGDYQGLAADGRGFVAAVAVNSCAPAAASPACASNPSDIVAFSAAAG